MAVFSLTSLGLTQGSVGDNYNLPRGSCFHSGIDYRTGGAPMRFLAAVYGTVVEPIGGDWGTVSVQPFGTTDLIQYLHCSTIDVSVGDIVAPWTQLGMTGAVCPPGTCNGVHLHLQVVARAGSPTYPCWSRNYLDPGTWGYVHPLKGTWTRRFTTHSTNARWDYTQTVVIHDDLIPTPNVLVDEVVISLRTGAGLSCTMQAVSRYTLVFEGYNANRTKVRTVAAGASMRQIGGNADCRNLRFTQHGAQTGELLLRDSQLEISGTLSSTGGAFARTSLLPVHPDTWRVDEDARDLVSITDADLVLAPGACRSTAHAEDEFF